VQPSVGRTVHYVSYGTPGGEYASECRAAIITEVTPLTPDMAALADIESWPDEHRCTVGLAVLNPTGQFFNRGCHQDEVSKRGGTWHWPERV
jgi:hypothetical protein